MSTVARELLVFVASPGDCNEERRRVRVVAERVTQALGTELGVRVRVTGWEDVPPDLGRPQGQINPLVDDCDLFVGILGHRWGSPTGTHESGFLEEFERAVGLRGDGDDPHIALFFRAVSSAMAGDPGPQLTAVLDFEQRLRDEHLALYAEFDDADDLERHLWPLIAARLLRLSVATENEPEGSSDGSAAASDRASTTLDEGVDMDDARRQIADATDGVTQLVRGTPTGSIDADRLLSIALAINSDPGVIPPHLANRLYRRRGDLALSVAEHDLWLRTVAADMGTSLSPATQVVPGWALLKVTEGQIVELLADEDDDVSIGTFRLLQKLQHRPALLWDSLGNDSRDEVANRWAAAIRRPRVSTAAVEYLVTLAQVDDMPLLDAICQAEEDASVRELRAFLAGDPGLMAKAVANEYSPPGWKVALVSGAIAAVDDDALRSLLTTTRASGELRRVAFGELQARSLVDEHLLRVLITQPAIVDAVFAYVEGPATQVSIETVASIVASLDANVSQRHELSARVTAAITPVESLHTLLDVPGTGVAVWDALGWKRDKASVLRARSIFDADAEELVAPLDENWSSRDLLPFVRSQARLAALRILTAAKPVPDEDRDRVRVEVARGDLYTMSESMRMLAAIATADDFAQLRARLRDTYGDDRKIVVDAIFAVGGTDGARDLIDSGEKEAARAVGVLGADPAVHDDELRALLHSAQAEVRIAALDELAKRLPIDAQHALLDEYPQERDSYFYNVIVQLDWLLHGGLLPPERAES